MCFIAMILKLWGKSVKLTCDNRFKMRIHNSFNYSMPEVLKEHQILTFKELLPFIVSNFIVENGKQQMSCHVCTWVPERDLCENRHISDCLCISVCLTSAKKSGQAMLMQRHQSHQFTFQICWIFRTQLPAAQCHVLFSSFLFLPFFSSTKRNL